MSDTLQEQIRWRVRRAEGFLLLGMTKAARAELEALPASAQTSDAVREAWLQQAMAEKDWPQAVILASHLRAEKPARPEFWVWDAYSRRRSEGVPQARAILEEARRLFPAVAVVPYNLACYACVAGDLDNARHLLREAFTHAPDMAGPAAEDEDLQLLWDELEALVPSGA